MNIKEEKTRFITKAVGMGQVFSELDKYYDSLEKESPGAKAKYTKWLEDLSGSKLILSFDYGTKQEEKKCELCGK